MEKRYNNPSIEEALCEFQFLPNQPWDITIPGLIYDKIKEEFPKKEQELGLTIVPKEDYAKVQPVPPKIQFFREDKKALVQVAPNLLAINHLKPYPSWDNFKPMIIRNFNIYKEIANPKGFKRIELRYINVFNFDKGVFVAKDYFNYYPNIPQDLPQVYTEFRTNIEFFYENNNEVLRLGVATLMPEKPNTVRIVLDIAYIMEKMEFITFDKIDEWLDRAHKNVERAFESCITDKTRQLLM